jgi:hypothetical protein
VGEEELCVSSHAYTVVGESVEEHHDVAIGVAGMDGPCMQCHAVRRDDGNVLEI